MRGFFVEVAGAQRGFRGRFRLLNHTSCHVTVSEMCPSSDVKSLVNSSRELSYFTRQTPLKNPLQTIAYESALQ